MYFLLQKNGRATGLEGGEVGPVSFGFLFCFCCAAHCQFFLPRGSLCLLSSLARLIFRAGSADSLFTKTANFVDIRARQTTTDPDNQREKMLLLLPSSCYRYLVSPTTISLVKALLALTSNPTVREVVGLESFSQDGIDGGRRAYLLPGVGCHQ